MLCINDVVSHLVAASLAGRTMGFGDDVGCCSSLLWRELTSVVPGLSSDPATGNVSLTYDVPYSGCVDCLSLLTVLVMDVSDELFDTIASL